MTSYGTTPSRVTVLGCGSSTGTPAIEFGWGKCDPNNPKNRRTRPSLLIEVAGKTLLIDASPDLREQLLRLQAASALPEIDALLFTHAHADHVHGIDDIRSINRLNDAPLEAWAHADTWGQIKERFAYAVEPIREGAMTYYKPTLEAHTYEDYVPFTVAGAKEGIQVLALEQDHGFSVSHGFRLGDFAYTADVVAFPERSLELLEGVKTWILGAFNWTPHPTHAHVDLALEWIERVGPERCLLTHLSPAIDYAALEAYVPANVAPAFDGCVIDIASATGAAANPKSAVA